MSASKSRAACRISNWIALSFILGQLGIAQAFLPPDDGGGGGGGGGGGTQITRCLENTVVSLNAVPATIDLGGSAMLRWSIKPPNWCALFNRVVVNGQHHDLTGSIDVQPSVTTSYPLMLIIPGGFKTLGPITVTVNLPAIVTLSPGSQVTAQDIAQFDARWMSEGDRNKRLGEYEAALMDRRAWIAWGLFDDASAMVRMFELTHDTKYLDHLRKVNDIALKYRDDQHPGDAFPDFNNPVCLQCRKPELVDRVRGRVMPAWGSGILYTDYVINGGLNPVDAVTSGMYLYGIASFARLVAEHPDPERRTAYRDDAIKFANAAIETMWAFMPEWDTRQAGSFVEGTIFRPRRFPTADECDAANARAKEHVRLFDPDNLEGLSKLIDDKKPDCNTSRDYAGKPLAHNESGALVMSFIELWRFLDSDFYRTSPAGTSSGELARGVIPLVVARHQRYFFERLRPEGERYSWNYNDDVPHPHTEDTSHANLDMFHIDVLRRSFDRLNAQVASVGEPIPLDDAMLRRFANTFAQQIARPAEIDRGGNVRGNVDGAATKPNDKGETDGNNWVLDGWIALAAVDATVYRLCRSVLLRTNSSGFQKYLGPGSHSALLANKRFAGEERPAPRPCPIGRKCCEPAPNGGCDLCVPYRAECP